MSIGLLLITHGRLGIDLLATAREIFGNPQVRADALEVKNDAPLEPLLEQAERLADRLDDGSGLLVLTDLYGATPANLAQRLAQRHRTSRVVAGINLPMLVRAMNYAALDLDALEQKAHSGGRDGVLCCPRPEQGD
jgi:mannose PTS system EIIA component